MLVNGFSIVGMRLETVLQMEGLRRRHRGIDHRVGVLVQANGKTKVRYAGAFEKRRDAKQQMFEHALRLLARAVMVLALVVRREHLGAAGAQRDHLFHTMRRTVQGDHLSIGRIRATVDRDIGSGVGHLLGEYLSIVARLREGLVCMPNCIFGR